MEAVHSSESSENFYQTTLSFILERSSILTVLARKVIDKIILSARCRYQSITNELSKTSQMRSVRKKTRS